MRNRYWFDTLNKALVREAPRREMLLAAAAAVGVNLSGFRSVVQAAKKRKKNKKKKKGKGPPTQCGLDALIACEAGYDAAEDIQFCKDKCERCEAAGTDFCVFHMPDEEHDDIHATCCPRGEACCGARDCCPPALCCVVDGVTRCLDPGETCCPSDDAGYCQEGSQCCRGGQGCQFCDLPTVLNLDTCECECADGSEPPCGCDENCLGPVFACCDGVCKNVTNDADHCGGCGLRCINPNRPDCCAGQCFNTEFCRAHCGVCNHHCDTNEGCVRGVCRCTEECCNGNDSGVCTSPRFCCPEPCSLCSAGICLRWRDGVVGGYCEERIGECRVVQQYCPNVPGPNVCDDYDCCGSFPVMETCTATGCERV